MKSNKNLNEIQYQVLKMLQEYSHCSPSHVWEVNKRKKIVLMEKAEFFQAVNILRASGYLIEAKGFFGESIETTDDNKVDTFKYTHLEALWLGMIKKK